MQRHGFAFSAAAVFLFASAAAAHPVTVEFSGTIDRQVFNLPASLSHIALGDTFFGTYTYDSGATDFMFPLDPNVGKYESVGPPFGFSVTVGGTVFQTLPDPDGRVLVTIENNNPLHSADAYDAAANMYDIDQSHAGYNVQSWNVALRDNSQTAFNDDTLVPPDFAAFPDFRWFGIFGQNTDTGGNAVIRGTVEQLWVVPPAPEPSTVALLAIAAAGIAWGRRRRALA
ncbi:MAG: PEP-CTERM sorting domain-containing protein [Planctomycetota bacterium]|jgi:hypothetical protein